MRFITSGANSMATDYVSIGPAPCDEECAQVGDDDYINKARSECQRYIALIRKVVGPEPFGARLVMQANHHDFGTYYEVICKYDEDNEEATQYAFRCEDEAPTRWETGCTQSPKTQ